MFHNKKLAFVFVWMGVISWIWYGDDNVEITVAEGVLILCV